MKYITDGKDKLHDTKSGEDVATRTLYTMAKRRQRSNYFSYSLIFLCVIFFLSLIVGSLLYIYLKRTESPLIFEIGQLHSTVSFGVKTALKRYFLSFLPFALIFVLGFTPLSSLINGLICAGFGAFSGFFAMYMYKSFAAEYLTVAISLGIYCFVLLYFSAISVSFSHSINLSHEFDGMFEDDLCCYLRYLLTSASLILAVCIIYHII